MKRLKKFTHARMHTRTQTSTHARMDENAHACMQIRTHARTTACMHASTTACMHARAHVRAHARKHACRYRHTHARTNASTHASTHAHVMHTHVHALDDHGILMNELVVVIINIENIATRPTSGKFARGGSRLHTYARTTLRHGANFPLKEARGSNHES